MIKNIRIGSNRICLDNVRTPVSEKKKEKNSIMHNTNKSCCMIVPGWTELKFS